MQHAPKDPLAHLSDALAELERAGLRRTPAVPTSGKELSFCSNDYLGLATRLAPPVATGAGASRLIAGNREVHRALERELARWLGTEDALVFSSGYAANVGVLSALAGAGDLVVSDTLNHASLIDGARLSRARVAVVPHNDVDAVRVALERRAEPRAWVAVESYYSMDADGPDLGSLRQVCDAHGAGLLVDEAHALGVYGPSGRGRAAEAGVVPDVLVGTLGKSFGGQGAFAAGRTVLRDWLWNRARSFVFSTGLAPVSAASARSALVEVVDRPERAAHLLSMADRFRHGLERAGAVPLAAATSDPAGPRLLGFGHVIPVVVGAPEEAVRLAERLRRRAIDAQAIRPPTVPAGTARLRFTVTARHQETDIDRAIDAYAWAVSDAR